MQKIYSIRKHAVQAFIALSSAYLMAGPALAAEKPVTSQRVEASPAPSADLPKEAKPSSSDMSRQGKDATGAKNSSKASTDKAAKKSSTQSAQDKTAASEGKSKY